MHGNSNIKLKEKYLKVKYRLPAVLLNVNTMICFKFNLRLKSIDNKNYSFIIANFQVGAKNTLKLKLRKKKIIIRTGSLSGTLSLLCCLNR